MRYKIVKATLPASGQTSYKLTVPPKMATLIPAETRFTIEFTDEGILYRAAKDPEPCLPPTWTRDT